MSSKMPIPIDNPGGPNLVGKAIEEVGEESDEVEFLQRSLVDQSVVN